MTLELARHHFMVGKVERQSGDYRQLSGVEGVALALATLAVTLNKPILVAGYPITPASAILQECAQLESFGVRLFQAEDEIAAIGACLGASFGGSLAVTCTSGPGLDLKSEMLGLAVVSELPLVVIDVQRAGASTGMPTKTGQSDLHQALYGRHGEAPVPIICAQSPGDCFYTIIEAFKIAVQFMTPVIVLLDAYLANAAEPWRIPEISSLHLPKLEYNRFNKPYMRNESLTRSWNIPGTPGYIHQLGGLEKQGDDGKVSYDAENHQKMVKLRQDKINNLSKTYHDLKLDGDEESSVLVVGWGSTYGNLKALVAACKESNISIAVLHIRNLYPLHNELGSILKSFNKILVAELNTGHLCQLLRATYLVDARPLSQCTGQPFTTSYLLNALKAEMV